MLGHVLVLWCRNRTLSERGILHIQYYKLLNKIILHNKQIYQFLQGSISTVCYMWFTELDLPFLVSYTVGKLSFTWFWQTIHAFPHMQKLNSVKNSQRILQNFLIFEKNSKKLLFSCFYCSLKGNFPLPLKGPGGESVSKFPIRYFSRSSWISLDKKVRYMGQVVFVISLSTVTREYWRTNRGPGFLADLAPSPPPIPLSHQ